jgi:phosphoribosylglycinamide formyltransferase 1
MRIISLFASGSGTNMQNIANYFDNKHFKIAGVFTNNANAYVIERSKKLNIPVIIFNREEFLSGKILNILKNQNPDLIVLAGFLWLIPPEIINYFKNKIINVHPALLPKYGGKGMYGDNVHKAVIENRETESGITIHYVNEHYDEGNIIFQAKCEINKNDTPNSLAQKIHELEYKHYPRVIEDLLWGNDLKTDL